MPPLPSRTSRPLHRHRDYVQQPDSIRRANHWLALVALGLSSGGRLRPDDPVGRRPPPTRTAARRPARGLRRHSEACTAAIGPGLPAWWRRSTTRDRWHDLTCEKSTGPPAPRARARPPAVRPRRSTEGCATATTTTTARTNSLVRHRDDEHCTAATPTCRAHTSGGGPQFEHKVTSFAKDHPELGSSGERRPAVPKRTLKFSIRCT